MENPFSCHNISLLKGCNFLFSLVVAISTLFQYHALQNVTECSAIVTASVFIISGILLVEALLICFSAKQLCKLLYLAEIISLIASQTILVFIVNGIMKGMG
mgnify:CR=1 FL=1